MALALIIFGIAFIVIEIRNTGRRVRITSIDNMDFKTAILIGLFQVLAAIFPGTSRSGATILGGLLIGVKRSVAAEFTFLLAVPVMAGASILKVVKAVVKGAGFTGAEVSILAVGMIVAFAVSLLVIRFLMNYIRRHDFKVFGWYRIALGIIVLVVFGIRGALI